MSRHLIGANRAIFAHLDAYCASRGQLLQNASRPRWIASQQVHRHFMVASVLSESISFSPGRKLARLDLSSRSYIVAVGFAYGKVVESAVEHDLTPAFLTVALAELLPRPAASISLIRDVIEASDQEAEPSYRGHDFDLIASLFPSVRVFECSGIAKPATWNVFFRACVEECEFGGTSWIEGELASTLRAVCDLDPERIPYRVLCRSVFDGDPTSFFLALYRCLEALYAYSSAKELVTALDLTKRWDEVAIALEDRLGWHPREESSLGSLLLLAAPHDLQLALRAMGERDDLTSQELINWSTRRIYWVRNAIVHYRPAQQHLKLDRVDWPLLCTAMAGMVVHVYGAVFSA